MQSVTFTNGTVTFEMDYENTMVVLFAQNKDLDHAAVTVDGKQFTIYDKGVLAQLGRYGFPVYYRYDVPDWAVARFMRTQSPDFDKLLEG